MQLPPEISLLIIQNVVETDSLENLLRVRLVNSWFAKEIKNQLIRHPRLESDGLKFSHEGDPGPVCFNRKCHEWKRFPHEWKREYLHHKVQQDAKNPSIVSRITRRLADYSGQTRTPEEEYILIDKLMDAWIINRLKINSCNALLSIHFTPEASGALVELQEFARSRTDYNEGIVLQQLLAISAVVRGDAAEFKRILDETSGILVKSSPGRRSESGEDFLSISFARLSPPLMRVVSEFGNADIMKVVLDNQRPKTYTQRYWLRGDLLSSTTRNRNVDGLKALIEYLAVASDEEVSVFRSTPRKTLSNRLRPAFRECFQFHSIDMMDVILDQCGSNSNDPDLQFDILMQAIKSGNGFAVQYALKKDSSQVNRQSKSYNYLSPLFYAYFTHADSKSTRRYEDMRMREPGPSITKMLLENGADLYGPHPATKKTLLQYAIEQKIHGHIRLILAYETERYGVPSILSGDEDRRSFWLRTAFHGHCFFLIELLYNNGVRSFVGKRARYSAVMVDPDEESDDEDLPDIPGIREMWPRRWTTLPIHFYVPRLVDEVDGQPLFWEDCICRPWCTMPC